MEPEVKRMSREVIPGTIAVDGPAASGKSTVARQLAKKLGYLFFDTGVMYRAVTWETLQRGIPVTDEKRVSSLAREIRIDVRPPEIQDGRTSDVLVDGKDITWKIRLPEVDANVSMVSAYPEVRKALSAQQRRIGLRGSVVMVGRDIGTVVLPDAELKIYLDASVEERARRRYQERLARGEQVDYDDILQRMKRRDTIDSTREVAPLCVAKDAVIIDTEGKAVPEIIEMILELIKQIPMVE